MIEKFFSFDIEDWKKFGIYEIVWDENEVISEEEWEEIKKLLDEFEELDRLEELEKLNKSDKKK